MSALVFVIGLIFCTYFINNRNSDIILKSLCYLFLITTSIPFLFYIGISNINIPFNVTNVEYWTAFNYITCCFIFLILVFKTFGKIFIAIWTIVITLLGVGYSLIIPETFKSTVTILPDNPASKFASSGLGDLAIMAGVAMPSEGSLLRLYPNIIKSEIVLKDIVYKKFYSKKFNDSLNLIKILKIKEKSAEREY